MMYKVDLDTVPYPGGTLPHAWVANVKATEPERVLLRSFVGNLEQCRDAIGTAITKHVLNPWGGGEAA